MADAARATRTGAFAVGAVLVISLGAGLAISNGTPGSGPSPASSSAASTRPSTGAPSPAASAPAPGATYTIYAHAPISAKHTAPAGYVRALRERSDWADGLFLYYPASLPFGARPEIDALQKAYPDGVPLTVSAKNADAAGLAAFRDQLTPEQAAVTLWERWQEPADDFTTPAARAGFRADVLADIEILRPAGVRVGVHYQCWTLDPANPKPWAGEQALLELIPPEVDIVTASCVGRQPDSSGPPQMQLFVDFMAEHYPGVDVGFTMLAWAVPAGTPEASRDRADRAEAARAAIDFALSVGVRELGWFDFADWEGRDTDVSTDPALHALLAEVSARPLPR